MKNHRGPTPDEKSPLKGQFYCIVNFLAYFNLLLSKIHADILYFQAVVGSVGSRARHTDAP